MTEHPTKSELLEAIVDRRLDDLFRFAYFRLGRRAEAEDAVQEVLLKLFGSGCDLSQVRDVERYLLKALANRCAGYHRKRRTAPMALEDVPPQKAEQPDDELHREYERLCRLLATLPAEQAEVIRMKISDGRTFRQIAEVTETPEATVKSRFRYGIGKLREIVHHQNAKEMKCSCFRNRIDRLFDSETPENKRTEMLRHLAECPDCALYYRQMKFAAELAIPRCEVHAPSSLKERIRTAAIQRAPAIEQTPEKSAAKSLGHRSVRWLRPLAGVAACILLALLLVNPGRQARVYAAQSLFRHASAALGRNGPFYREMDVRTRPGENFGYIDASQPFIRHRLWVVPGVPGQWRLDKGGRTACSDGRQIRMWTAESRAGWIHPLSASAIEEFSLLLDPRTLLLQEEALAADNPRIAYTKQVEGEEIRLTVDAPASGAFTNEYTLNSSIGESDSRREYHFDRTTGRLTGITISQRIKGRTIPVVALRHIDYDAEIPDSLIAATPADIEWKDLTRPVGGAHFTRITPVEAARKLFGAMQVWDKAILQEVLAYYSLEDMKRYAGCRLLQTKPAFRSGQYPGVFVPCLLALDDGSTSWINLALRNDNRAQAWVADGGI